MNTQEKIAAKCDEIKELLLAKNRSYGNSALEPMRIFSKSDASEQIRVRLDDKLSRLANGKSDVETDVETIKDLIGYGILLLIAIADD